MAVEKYLFLDETGVQTLSQYLLKVANTRIKERITTYNTTTGLPAAGAYSDDTHTLSAKAILSLIGNIGNYSTSIDGTGSTVLDKIKALDLAIGTEADSTANDGTVWGEIAQVRTEISGLTHLTYQKVDGPISSVVNPQDDVIYLQHDADAPKIGLDGYLKTSNGDNASVTLNEGEANEETYYGYYDATADKYYKATETGGVFTVDTSTELQSDDDIFDVAGTVADNTYTLYIHNLVTPASGNDPAVYEWLAVGDTSLTLDGYWSKSDADVNALKNKIVGSLATGDATTQGTIVYGVKAAFDATDPYANNEGASYLDSWVTA